MRYKVLNCLEMYVCCYRQVHLPALRLSVRHSSLRVSQVRGDSAPLFGGRGVFLTEIIFLVHTLILPLLWQYWNLWMVCCFWRTRESLSNKGKAQYLVTYTRAVQRKLIKGIVYHCLLVYISLLNNIYNTFLPGLSTYNMLQNPIYKEAFAITWWRYYLYSWHYCLYRSY